MCTGKRLLTSQEFEDFLGYLLIALNTHEILGVGAVGEEGNGRGRVPGGDVNALHVALGRIAAPNYQMMTRVEPSSSANLMASAMARSKSRSSFTALGKSLL